MLTKMNIIDHLFRIRNYGLRDIFDHEALIKAIHLLKDNPNAREMISYTGSTLNECQHANGFYSNIEIKYMRWFKKSKRVFACSDCWKLIEMEEK